MTSGPHSQPAGPGPAQIALSTITVQLGLLDVLGPAFLRRHEALPYEVNGQTLRLVSTRAADPLLADEIAFCTGLRVEVAAPREAGLPKLIESCIEAWSRGERTFVTAGAGGAVADADLVYLEDLGSLAAMATDGASARPIAFADAGDLADLGRPGGQTDLGAVGDRAPRSTTPAEADHPDTGVLPAVVDLTPRARSGPRAVVTPRPGAEPPSAHATTLEASQLGDEALLDDVDLLQDVDLLEDLEPGSTPGPRLERDPTGVPQHRPAAGLAALLASGQEDQRHRLVRVARTLGFAVQEATRTLEVLEQLGGRSADLLLLDVDLAGTHAMAAARQLRGEARHARMAIVVAGRMTRTWQLEADLAATYGVDAYMEQPFDTPTLLWTLERALASRRPEPLALRDPDAVARGRELLTQATALYRQEAVDEAVDLFQRGLQHDPFEARLHASLAIALVKRREHYAAMDAFERAIALDPRLTSAIQNLAVLYEKKGFRNKALELWIRTLHATKEEDQQLKLRGRIAKLL